MHNIFGRKVVFKKRLDHLYETITIPFHPIYEKSNLLMQNKLKMKDAFLVQYIVQKYLFDLNYNISATMDLNQMLNNSIELIFQFSIANQMSSGFLHIHRN